MTRVSIGGVRMHRNIIARIVTYYVAIILLAGVLFYAFPVLGHYLEAERARQGARATLELDQSAEPVHGAAGPAGTLQLMDPERSVPVFISLVSALLVALPVAWVYRWTRPRRRYSQTFAQTLIVVPIAITLVVFLVKGSLALAFSLAGIVAAVRFRTTLDEPLDAVYLFLVIGTGLAAGVQLLFVAIIASILFNAVTLTVWRLNVGSQPAVLDGWRLVAAPPDLLAPAAPARSEDAADDYNTRLRLHVTNAEAAQRFAIPFLQERARQWRLVDAATDEDGTAAIDFDLRLKKSIDLAAFIREIERGDPNVTRAELTRLKSKMPKGG